MALVTFATKPLGQPLLLSDLDANFTYLLGLIGGGGALTGITSIDTSAAIPLPILTNGIERLRILHSGASVDYAAITAVTGAALFSADGGSTNIEVDIYSKGTGPINLAADAGAGPILSLVGATGSSGVTLTTALATDPIFSSTASTIRFSTNLRLGSSNTFNWNGDTILERISSGVVGQRNAANAQAFRAYFDASTYTEVGGSVRGILTTGGALRLSHPGPGVEVRDTAAGMQWTITGTMLPAASLSQSVGSASAFLQQIYTGRTVNPIVAITYSASMTPDASAGEVQEITFTNGTAWTLNAPTGGVTGQRMSIRFRNSSGGALGAGTINTVYKMATANPANGNSIAVTYVYNGTNWVEIERSGTVPN